MIALLQRVSEASVTVDGSRIAVIGKGVLVLVAVEPADGNAEIERMAEKLLGFRLFADASGRMNLDTVAAGGQFLLVPQFTLAADTTRGNRPGFSTAAPPELAEAGFCQLVEAIEARGEPVATGRFGADMQVALINDGPVTFWLRVESAGKHS